jgi:hypothetical protein
VACLLTSLGRPSSSKYVPLTCGVHIPEHRLDQTRCLRQPLGSWPSGSSFVSSGAPSIFLDRSE